MSRVRACRLVGLNRSSLNYQSKRPDDSTVRQRLRELAAERRRFGYRRLGWLLVREGHVTAMRQRSPRPRMSWV
jgi:putative transposase